MVNCTEGVIILAWRVCLGCFRLPGALSGHRGPVSRGVCVVVKKDKMSANEGGRRRLGTGGGGVVCYGRRKSRDGSDGYGETETSGSRKDGEAPGFGFCCLWCFSFLLFFFGERER